jgi:uncharacterized small protein (DUF1192 family)
MDWDEPKLTTVTSIVLGEDLSRHSVVELDARIAHLKIEIDRASAALAAKRKHTSAAAELFGKS